MRVPWKEPFEAIVGNLIPRGSHAWSVSELNLSGDDYHCLVEVFSGISGLDWEIFQYGQKDDWDRAGLLLVVVMAEHARRHTRGDQIWRCMKNLPMRDCLRRRFFLSNGQPTRDLRVVIESAAYRWNLRHVFNIPGHMAWFVTLFLQFGFSQPAAKKRLPFWLSGQILPVAVTYLLGGQMQSPTFVLMWQSLRAYRMNHITEGKCREFLERSAWVLSEWIPDLLRLAKSRLDLVDHAEAGAGEELEPLILGDAQLVWPSGEEPFFRCEILAAATFELEEACYEIRSSSFDPVRLVRQEGGDYYVVGDSQVDVPLGRASLQCTLIALSSGAGEEDVATQSVALWDPHYPISLYRRNNGSRMSDPEQPVRLDEGSFAVFHGSFTIEPQPLRAFEHHHWWVAELPTSRVDGLALLQDGERVWWPEPKVDAQNGRGYTVSITRGGENVLKWNQPDSPPEICCNIWLDRGGELQWVRFGHEVVDFENKGRHHYRTMPFGLRPEHAVYPLYVTVGFRADGRMHRITQRVELNLSACFLENEGTLSIYESRRALNIRNASRFLFHILRPVPQGNEEEQRRYWIVEGTRIVRPIAKRGISLSQLAGYGEPLHVFYGLYNTERQPELLIERVRDNGGIQTVAFNERGFELGTCAPIELDEKHELIAWTMDHRFIRLSSDRLEPQEDEGTWFCDLTEWQDSEGRIPIVKAMGFFYEGQRLGNWFDRKFFHAITKIETDEEAARCAEMLRWFKAPVLDPEVSSAMRFLLKSFSGEVIPMWLRASESPELKLAEQPVDDEWLRVVSTLCRSVSMRELTLADASQIVEEVFPDFSPSNLEESLPKALECLDGVSPNLIAKIAHLYLSEMSQGRLPGNFAATKRAVLERFQVGEQELQELCEGRENELDRGLGISPFFVRHMFARIVENSRDLTAMEEHNRDLLLNHRIMRRLLAHLYLSRL